MTPQFLDGELSASENDPATARFRIIPMPLERTVSYGSGTANGPQAILEASEQLERLCRGDEPCRHGIHTVPPVDCTGPLPDVMARLSQQTHEAMLAGKIPVTLGGEHSLTYGAVMGLREALDQPIGIVQIDAHADLRKAYQGEKHSHASVMQLLANEGVALAQFGVRALCQEEVDRREEHNVFYVDAEDLVTQRIHGIELPDDFPDHVYISFDLDGLDPAEMPATGTPVPGGLSYWQAIHLAEHALEGRTLVGMDVVELAPIEGQDGWNFTAAQVAYSLMGLADRS
ncbi:MAG: agmatinase [Pseudomonadota bacterium]